MPTYPYFILMKDAYVYLIDVNELNNSLRLCCHRSVHNWPNLQNDRQSPLSAGWQGSTNPKDNTKEQPKTQHNMKATPCFLLVSLTLLLVSFASTARQPGTLVVLVKRRYRRTVGQRTRCVKKIAPYCSVFTHGKVVKDFCLHVMVKFCTALDK